MNFNVDRLWDQSLVHPEDVLKLIPKNNNNLVLHILHLLAQRVQLQQGKLIEYRDSLKKIEGIIIKAIFRLEYFKKYQDLQKKMSDQVSQLVNCFQHWSKKVKNQKETQLIQFLAFLNDEKMAVLRANQLTHLFFMDFVVVDLLRMMNESKLSEKQLKSLIQEQKSIKLNKMSVEQLLKILQVTVPTVLQLIRLKQNQLPFSLRHYTKNILYVERPLEWILKKSQRLAYFNRILIETLISKDDLTFSQQLLFTKIVFRYFYAYHQQRKMMAVQMLFQTYNKIDGAVRFALASQFGILLQVANKVGKAKMVQAMASKSKWIEELLSKQNRPQQEVYIQKEMQVQGFRYGQTIILKPSEDTVRYFQIIEEYSIGHVSIMSQSEFQLQISRVNDFQGRQFEEVLVENRKIKEFKERIVFKKSGLYKVNMSNAISWISTKKIVFGVNILSPIQLQQKSTQEYSWKKSYISLGSYQPLTVNKLQYEQKTLNGIVHIYRSQLQYRFEIHPIRNSNTYLEQYQTDNQQRFLQRIKHIFNNKQQLLFIFKEEKQEDRELESFEELLLLFDSKREKRQKSIVIQIPIKQSLH